MYKGSLFSIPSPSFAVVCFPNDCHYDWGEIESLCGFDLHFSVGNDVEHFSHVSWPFVLYLLRTACSLTPSLIRLFDFLVFSVLAFYVVMCVFIRYFSVALLNCFPCSVEAL